ncbi:MAG: DUF4832 domain-containing protein [bacterium]|nr:DUF4832 domain-containing protein [bacterium]
MRNLLLAATMISAQFMLSPFPVSAQTIIFQDGFESGNVCRWSFAQPEGCQTGNTDVIPVRIDDVLVNPGMGFANFHFGWWCNLPPVTFPPQVCADRVFEHWPENYPPSAVAYFRWSWKEIEPVRGEIDFEMIDTAIQSANLMSETLGFRIMTIAEGDAGVPQWLLDPPYSIEGEWLPGSGGSTFWPDYRGAVFQAEHARLISALGSRYNGHPAVDHVDIGTVGCWGEWNTACLTDAGGIFGVFDPQTTEDYEAILAAYSQLIDDHVNSFPDTPTVMLGLGSGWELDTMLHAIDRGTGWRVDCWGDWGFWPGWSHMEDLYPAMINNATAKYPGFPHVFEHAPIQLEICGSMPQWEDFGWTTDPPDGEVYKTFQWALEQHASVLNAKFTPIPAAYVSAIDDLLKENGYRFVIDLFNHSSEVDRGSSTTFLSTWHNLGVAPVYLPRKLMYRLSNGNDIVTSASATDVKAWMPGTYRVSDTVSIPPDLPIGTYALEVAILDRAGVEPDTVPLPPLFLGIEGRQADGWYSISQITVIQP